MVKVIQLADDGTETASIEVDDFTIEVIYAGLAGCCATPPRQAPPRPRLPRGAVTRRPQRRQRVLSRLRD